MDPVEQQSISDEGDAAWAHNRWPNIGLFTGWGLGVLLWILFPRTPWWLAVLNIFLLGCLGCAIGWGAAVIVYRGRRSRQRERTAAKSESREQRIEY